MPSIVEFARFTDDVDGTVAFYEAVLGESPEESWPGGAVFETDGVELLVHETNDPGENELPPEDHVAVGVEDLDAACESLRADGFAVEREPAEYYWGRSAYLRDPDGRQVELREE